MALKLFFKNCLTSSLASVELHLATHDGIHGQSESHPKKRNRATAQPRNRAIVQGILSPHILTIQNTADLEFPASTRPTPPCATNSVSTLFRRTTTRHPHRRLHRNKLRRQNKFNQG
jgi:hypothetical protein